MRKDFRGLIVISGTHFFHFLGNERLRRGNSGAAIAPLWEFATGVEGRDAV